MELDELEQRLLPFCRAQYNDTVERIHSVHAMPGHAGFAYGFSVDLTNATESWFLRLPPPNVKWQGTADVLRQVAVLNILPQEIPHCPVKWSGDDLQWFGRPYFVVPKLLGDVVRQEPGAWTSLLTSQQRQEMAEQAMTALAAIHSLSGEQASYLGEPMAFAEDVRRWDRFVEKAADPERLMLAAEVKELLLQDLPEQAPVGIFHGDFQWSNLFYSEQGKLLAVIDWELTGRGATLNDVGWIATFNDPAAWSDKHREASLMPEADELIAFYRNASGQTLPEINWFRALAAYKFAIITGFNLMLHRRGKRHDPMWETSKLSIEPLLNRARELLR